MSAPSNKRQLVESGRESGREQKVKVCLDTLRRTRFLTAGLQGSRGEESTEITKLRKERYMGNR